MKIAAYFLFFFMFIQLTSAQVPNTINWQGIITDSQNAPLNGTQSITLRLFELASGGTAVWSEVHNSVNADNGLVNLSIGSVNALSIPFNVSYWLEIQVGTSTPMPRIKLSSVPYALYSEKSSGAIINDSLVLKDSRGVTRMVLNPNTGTFKMMNNDTVWYEISVNSPPNTLVQGNNTYQQTTFNIQEGLFVTTTYSRETNRPIQTIKEGARYDSDGKVTQIFEKYDWDYDKTADETIPSCDGMYIATKEVRETTDGGKETSYLYYNPTNLPNAELTLKERSTKEKVEDTETTEVEHFNANQQLVSSEYKSESSTTIQTITKHTANHLSGNVEYRTTIRKIGEGDAQKEQTVKEEYRDDILTEIETIETKGDEKLRRYQNFQRDDEVVDEKVFSEGLWKTNYKVKKDGIVVFKANSERNGGYSKEEETTYSDNGNKLKEVTIEKVLHNGESLKENRTEIEYKNGVLYSEKFVEKTNAENGSEETVIYNPDGSEKTRRMYHQTNGIWYYKDSPKEDISKNSTTGQAFKQKLTPTGASFGPHYDTPGSPEYGIALVDGATGFKTGYKTYSGEYRATIETSYNNTTITSPGGSTIINSNANINGNTTASGSLTIGGNLNVNGTKNFRIDHPDDPENKYLVHAAVESDQVLNQYSGNAITNENNTAIIILPDYVQKVNKNFRYQLTVIGDFAHAIVSKEVNNNQFEIKTDKPNIKVSWLIIGERNDKYMQEHPFEPVIFKTSEK